MKGYKGFEPGLICRGKQYAENTVFEEDTAKICESGMHFCTRPIDVLKYYTPCDVYGKLNEFCVVEALDDAVTDDGKEYCTRKLKVGEKIGLDGLIKAEVERVMADIDKINEETKTINSGYRSYAINSGGGSAAISSGGYSVAIDSGRYSSAISIGESSSAISSGGGSAAISSGVWSTAVNSGEEGVAAALGIESKAKAALGGWIILTEWKFDEIHAEWHRVDLKSAQVDGKKIKADTWYVLKNGEFVEDTNDYDR